MAVAWDYENESYYHIYACSGPIEDVFSGLTLDLPQTEHNDAKIQKIVNLLNEVAELFDRQEVELPEGAKFICGWNRDRGFYTSLE